MPDTPAVTLGYEEEFFLIEAGSLLPTLQSLDALRKLYWKNPAFHRARLASNFARGKDRRSCWMSSIEVSTGVHGSPESLMVELMGWRKRIAAASHGALVVPIGAPLGLDSPSNTAGAHVHVGVPAAERDRVYQNLGYFLPVLAVASINSPSLAGGPKSYRMATNFASGDLREDREYRFQDLIVSKRLGTVEIRALDPIPDADRLLTLLKAVVAIARESTPWPFDRERYNAEKSSWVREGPTPWVWELWEDLQAVYPLPRDLLTTTEGDRLAAMSPQAIYEEVDRVWREGTGTEAVQRAHSRIRSLTGVVGYYTLQLPWMAYKGYKEWHGRTPDAARKVRESGGIRKRPTRRLGDPRSTEVGP